MLFTFTLSFKAGEVYIEDYDGDGYLIYDGTSDYLTINSEYDYQDMQFRGLWVSNFAGDISSYSTEAAFKKEMTTLLDIMEFYHLNALIFHVRTHNNALYDSKLNARASFWSRVKFDQFDPLEWLIDETHKRGIEFHAWMNPYRVKNSSNSYISGSDPQSNPASNPDNLLVCSSVTILDPGKEVVKSFLISTVLEFLNKYDVDAIHFDDYFYAEGCNDDKTYNENNPNGLNKADWRRNNVNEFIRRLSIQIKAFNERNNKSVQLGISPPGGWKNGNGKVTYDEDGHAVTNGTLGNGFTSYGDYLYADSKAWVDNEWLDYICPQCYHDIQNGYFAETTDWWNKVVKFSNTNLYIGIGFYGPSNSWQDPYELRNELFWLNKLENVRGYAIYAYSALKKAYNATNTLKKGQIDRAYRDILSKPTNLPILRRYEFDLPKISEIEVKRSDTSITFTFTKDSRAKYYLVYKDNTEIVNEIARTWGEVSGDKVKITVSSECENTYIVVPVGFDNRLGEAKTISKDEISLEYEVRFINDGEVLRSYFVKAGESVNPQFDIDYDKYDIEYSCDFSNINSNLDVLVTFLEKVRMVFVLYLDGEEYKTKEFKYSDDLTSEVLAFIPDVLGKEIIGLKEVDSDNYVVEYRDIKFTVRFFDSYGDLIDTCEVLYGETPNYPTPPSLEGYKFVSWSNDGVVTSDLDLYPKYQELILVTLLDEEGRILSQEYYEENDSVDLRSILSDKNYEFYIGDEKISDKYIVKENVIITCVEIKEINEPIDYKSGCKKASIINYYYLLGVLGALLVLRRRNEL